MNVGALTTIIIAVVAIAGIFLSVDHSATGAAVCAAGEWVEWGVTIQGTPYGQCGPVTPVNYTSTYIRIR